ncbi:MAG: Asp-tRNA(Asn)/Glu-tRNA(Gln) amidotransferase subunit GatB [Chloroflexi bacterium]|nr:Asp-tRNA(Asn)/Glu-tRNA(Gln) amidotransferase subunit GatB [Chloroflexota bacterium]MBP8054386.1 Asp-tRNA(Asn)/Glu-tRNA(Gln) amidotransferase subunit GatB [Chloroflexota bacterium]
MATKTEPTPTTEYETIIGLEIHAELMTESKMFCGCRVVDSVTAPPNTAVCPVCLGMPGMLPVINKRAVEFALRVALALNCTINRDNIFARKNYFYPDLPKSYQISQYEQPIGVNGWLAVTLEDGTTRRIGIRRVHLEEDTGKLTHLEGGGSLVDYNRSGVPLLEIVSEPEIHSGEEARAYAMMIRQILRYLGVNSGDMEKGVFRVEPNISLRPRGTTAFGKRTELKNLNSFKVLSDGTAYEIERQTALLRAGQPVLQETRGWHEGRRETFSQRSKEEAEDYRYFPEPDLPPLQLAEGLIAAAQASLPELPAQRITRYRQAGLSAYEARVLAEDKEVADWFDAAAALHPSPKTIANWLLNDLFRLLNESKLSLSELPISPALLVELIGLVEKQTISSGTAKEVLAEMVKTGQPAPTIVKAKGLAQISDTDHIRQVIEQILHQSPNELNAYHQGKVQLRGWFVGQIMRQLKGQGNPALVNQHLDELLRGEH